jgi:multidrug efflux pump subunit AcrB
MKNNQPKGNIFSKISLFLYKKMFLSLSLWLSIFVFGFLSYVIFMQREGFPQIDVPVSVVQSTYFVNDKNKVDSQVTKPLTEAISKVDQVKQHQATSTDGQSVIVVEYDSKITSQEGSNLIEREIAKIKDKLPKEAIINYQVIDAARYANKYDVLISVSAKGDDTKQLNQDAKAIATDIKNRLPSIKDAQVIEQYQEAVDPLSGNKINNQIGFDWFGQKDNSGNFVTNKSAVIGLRTSDQQDILAFDDELQNTLDGVKESDLYKNVDVNVSASFAPAIRQQIDGLQQNLLEGLIIVVLVSLIFIGLRAGVMAALGMLLTLATTIGALYLFGLSLNVITLFGLVLCLGLIVDDTVIMIEAIDRQKSSGKDTKTSIRDAIKKVALASTAGTFTTMLGFAPLLFIGGILGSFIRILPITIIVSLFFSLMVSLFFIPLFSKWFGSTNTHKTGFSKIFFVRGFTSWLGNSLASLILSAKSNKRKFVQALIAIFIGLIFVGLTGPVFSKLKFDIFPTTKDGNEIQVEFRFDPNVDIQKAEQITKSANEKIVNSLGENLVNISYLGTSNARSAIAELTLLPYEEREQKAPELVNKIKNDLANLQGARVLVSQRGAGPPKDEFPFVVRINADDTQKADKLAKNLNAFLTDRTITRQNGTQAKIKTVEYLGEIATIKRVDGQRVVEVSASFDADDTSALVSATQQEVTDNFASDQSKLAGLTKDDIKFDFGSESENQESFKSVVLALPFLVLAMFVLLALQFRSFVQPLLILIAVPFSFFGVALALYLSDNPLSFFVMVGFFALIGVSVNNTILLTDFANQGRKRGLSPRQAMAEAIQERTRPLMTTSVTTVLALLPLAFTDPFWESLAFTLIGGLLASTVLVLISFPYYYLVLEAIRGRIALKFKR